MSNIQDDKQKKTNNRSIIDAVSMFATLGGVCLGFDTLAVAVRDGQSYLWALFGLAVGCASASSMLDDLFSWFGNDPKTRSVGALSIMALVLILAAVIPLFRFAPDIYIAGAH